MIVAAGLSPASQTVMRFPSLAQGEVNRASAVWRCASGKVLDVAIALEALGCPTRAADTCRTLHPGHLDRAEAALLEAVVAVEAC